jgi:hypothetical protein
MPVEVYCAVHYIHHRRPKRPFHGEGRQQFTYQQAAYAAGKDVMTTEAMQKLGKDGMDMAMHSVDAWTKSAQAIVAEVVDYSKKSVEGSTAAWEKLMGAKSLETVMEVQSAYLKSSYEGFVAEATKLGEMYADLAKQTYKPLEGALAKARQ